MTIFCRRCLKPCKTRHDESTEETVIFCHGAEERFSWHRRTWPEFAFATENGPEMRFVLGMQV